MHAWAVIKVINHVSVKRVPQTTGSKPLPRSAPSGTIGPWRRRHFDPRPPSWGSAVPVPWTPEVTQAGQSSSHCKSPSRISCEISEKNKCRHAQTLRSINRAWHKRINLPDRNSMFWSIFNFAEDLLNGAWNHSAMAVVLCGTRYCKRFSGTSLSVAQHGSCIKSIKHNVKYGR